MASTPSFPDTKHVQLSVSFRGSTHQVSLPDTTTLHDLSTQIENLTSIPPHLQKLIYKGKNASNSDDGLTISEAGLKNGMKVVLIGSTEKDIQSTKQTESDQRKRDDIMRQRAARGPDKLRSTGSRSSSSPALNYRFHQLQPLPHLPNPAAATSLLTRLSEDPAVKHVMQKHQFAVGLLTELAPHEHPELLGLNENKGQAIKLRLRTDSYDGFRSYADVRRVLMHELTHNVWGPHDNNFKELNSQLNKEIAAFEKAVRDGTHSLLGDFASEFSQQDMEQVQHSHVLGGSSSGSSTSDFVSPEERRRRVAEAALRRLKLEEQEIEDRCGSGDGPSAVV